jgi:hypothetical protein
LTACVAAAAFFSLPFPDPLGPEDGLLALVLVLVLVLAIALVAATLPALAFGGVEAALDWIHDKTPHSIAALPLTDSTPPSAHASADMEVEEEEEEEEEEAVAPISSWLLSTWTTTTRRGTEPGTEAEAEAEADSERIRAARPAATSTEQGVSPDSLPVRSPPDWTMTLPLLFELADKRRATGANAREVNTPRERPPDARWTDTRS